MALSNNKKYSQRTTVAGSLLLPFGHTKKWDLKRIKLQYASTQGLHFESDVPFVHINKARKTPIYLCDAPEILSEPHIFRNVDVSEPEDVAALILGRLETAISGFMTGATESEKLFLKEYFALLRERTFTIEIEDFLGERIQVPAWTAALLPIPQVQIYCEDPLDPKVPPEPSNNFRVDFAFWTGSKLVAIEIDGYEPSGYSSDVRRDRLLRRAGIDLIHILNSEIEMHGRTAIRKLLPREISNHWLSLSEEDVLKADFRVYLHEPYDFSDVPF